jgi:hypothetical protein
VADGRGDGGVSADYVFEQLAVGEAGSEVVEQVCGQALERELQRH